MADSAAQHVITENTAGGKAVFYELPDKPKTLPTPFGTSTHVYVNPMFLPDVSVGSTADLVATAGHSQTGLKNMGGRICIDDGMVAVVLVINPGAVIPMHRTKTVDVGVVLDGEIELHIDTNDKRILKQGDTFVLRGGMHSWVNSTDKPTRMYANVIDTKTIGDGVGGELKEGFDGA